MQKSDLKRTKRTMAKIWSWILSRSRGFYRPFTT